MSESARRSVLAALGALVFAAAVAAVLSRDPFLRGLDGYYYALQADFWFVTGRVKIPDSSFVHRVVGATRWLGLGAEAGVRLWMAFSLGAFAAAFGAVASRVRSVVVFGGALLWAMASPSVGFVAIEFPKFMSFLPVLVLFPLVLANGRARWPLFLALGALAVACHRGALVYVGLLAAAVLGESGAAWLRERGRRLIHALTLAGACGALLLAYRLLFVDHVALADLARIDAAAWTPGLVTLLWRTGLPPAVVAELVAALIGCGGLVVRLVRSDPAERRALAPALLLVLPSFLPAWGTAPFAFGERYAMLLPVTAAMAIVFALRNEELAGDWGRRALPLPLLLAPAAGWFLPSYSHPPSLDPPFAVYRQVVEAIRGRDLPMLVAHQGLNFFYKFSTHRESFSYEPEDHWNKARVWRLVHGVAPDELFHYLPEECSYAAGLVSAAGHRDYALVREDCYVRMRARVGEESDPALFALLWESSMNPSKKRPSFLYEKHRGEDDVAEFPALSPAPSRPPGTPPAPDGPR